MNINLRTCCTLAIKLRGSWVIVLLLGIFGCNNIYQIEINKDGSALIEQEIIQIYEEEILERDSSLVDAARFVGGESEGTDKVAEEQFEIFIDNPIITNFVWESNKKHFYKISQVDSLGTYINKMYQHVFPVFTFTDKSFLMVCKSGEEEDILDSNFFPAIFVEINIKFPYKIVNVESNNEEIKIATTKKTIQLKMKLSSLFFRDEASKIRVDFN